ncbi:Stromal membrane-associated protein [Penicillium digitatum PHI26]|uniref:Stromal membrane-associated protein n=3 Tax=Penicillium digitatum TaxID=36651 RepID=K9GBN1_PEND2|nr:Stromal membrane-associated protein [Penicillium digitatum Pd1]EKV16346.1 Stromal membrane-associated protein [Penicillium digitatum Pd1]EKV18562.1 Stromal membrane-associated protein [Penicillium digitatum PHI26]
MGTHISRVKSVDLDAWTDEQLQSVVRWGNGRANKYWEAKLAPGHVPSDAKIENFIRTKYESKRWVMDGEMPDPSALDDSDDGDDDVPLAVVQEKAKIERSASKRVTTANQPPVHRQQASIDLFGDEISPPNRPSTTEPPPRAPPRQAQPAPVKTHKPNDSLLGLDFFGSTQPSTGSRPSSTASTPAAPAGMSRPDLKQSILSLYSKPQPTQLVQHQRVNSFGDMASPPAPSASSHMGGLTDAFSGLSFPTTTSPPLPKPAEKSTAFSNLSSFGGAKSTPAAPKITSPSGSAGGGFFDNFTSPNLSAPRSQSRTTSVSSTGQDFGFGGFTSPAVKPNPPSSSLSNDLFGFSSPRPASTSTISPPKSTATSQQEMTSAFNISAPPMQPSAPLKAPVTSAANAAAASMMSGSLDPWGGNAWSTPDPASSPGPAAFSPASMMKVPDTLTPNDVGHGWGAPSASSKPAPAVAADEDFGGWTSAAPVSNTTNSTKSGGFGGSDDLFSNVWE